MEDEGDGARRRREEVLLGFDGELDLKPSKVGATFVITLAKA